MHHRGISGLGGTTRPGIPFPGGRSDLHLSREGVAEPSVTRSPHQALLILLSPFFETQPHGSLPSEASSELTALNSQTLPISVTSTTTYLVVLKSPQMPKLYLQKRMVSKRLRLRQRQVGTSPSPCSLWVSCREGGRSTKSWARMANSTICKELGLLPAGKRPGTRHNVFMPSLHTYLLNADTGPDTQPGAGASCE